MTTENPNPQQKSYLEASGILSWIFSIDHKRVGLMYLLVMAVMLVIGSLLGMMLRVEQIPNVALTQQFGQSSALHGIAMIFLIVIPAIPASLGSFLLPLMLGARNIAFPRLNLVGFYFYAIGGIFLLFAFATGGFNAGWTFSTPLSLEATGATTAAALGIVLLAGVSIINGINMIVTIHKMRIAGMDWKKVPIFGWSLYANAIVNIVAPPVFALGLLMLAGERLFGIGVFDPALGGDPTLFMHLFWFYAHPLLVISLVPAFGVVAEIVAVHSRKRLFAAPQIMHSMILVAILSLFSWGQHLYGGSQSELASVVFGVFSIALLIPLFFITMALIMSFHKGSVAVNTPMLYAISFLMLMPFTILVMVLTALPATGSILNQNSYGLAQTHLIIITTFFALFAALHHWWQKIFGRRYSDGLAKTALIMILGGILVVIVPHLMLGIEGIPAGYSKLEGVLNHVWPNQLYRIAAMGSYLLIAGILVMVLNFSLSLLRKNTRIDTTSWKGETLEWQSDNPPSMYNFSSEPVCNRGPYDFNEIKGLNYKEIDDAAETQSA